MFKNYVKVAFRNLVKYRIHSIINILGLSIGIAISILILILVQDELSYDKYNEDWKHIYRVNRLAEIDGTHFNGAMTPLALKEELVREVSEVEAATRLIKGSHKRVSYESIHLSAENFYYADESFFKIFTIPLLQGDPSTVLSDSLTIVLTESTASTYFGDDDPIGKMLELDNGLSFRITGICKDVPDNSHFHFDYLASMKWIEKAYQKERWVGEITTTYLLAKQENYWETIQSYLPGIIERNITAELEGYVGEETLNFTDDDSFEFYLQPVSDIHLNSVEEGEFESGTDKVYIYVFIFIALLILPLACPNLAFDVNLGTFSQVLGGNFSQAAKHRHTMPLSAIFLFAGLLVLPRFAGRHAQVGDGVATGHVFSFRIVAEISDEYYFIDSASHSGPLFKLFARTIACEDTYFRLCDTKCQSDFGLFRRVIHYPGSAGAQQARSDTAWHR